MFKVLVDTNILIYATDKKSIFHYQSYEKLNYLLSTGHSLFFNGQVIREYINFFSTRGDLSLKQVIENVTSFRKYFILLEENEKTVEEFINMVLRFQVKGKKVFDCNLVAAMQRHQIPDLLTHNVRDFDRYREIINILPLLS